MKHYSNTGNQKQLRRRVLAILLSVLLCITLFPSMAFGATKYITPPEVGSISYTADALSGEWSFHKENPMNIYYQGLQITFVEDEKLTLNSDGTFLYNYSSGSFPVNPIISAFSESDSGSYSVSGDKITFVSSGKLNGTRSVLARYDKNYNHDLLTMDILNYGLARSGIGKLSEDGHVRPVSFTALYALEVGDLYVGFGQFGGTSVDVSSDGSNFVVEMYTGADIVNGEGVSGFITSDYVKSISASVLQKDKDPVACTLKIVPLPVPGYENLIKCYKLSVPKSSLASTTANFRYIEVFLNDKAFLLDTNKGFLSEVPSELAGSDNAATSSTSKKISDSKAFTIDIPDAAFAGKSTSGKVKITNNGKVLVKGKDYTITYKNNKQIGKATATIKGIGQYSGTKTITFKIVPKKTSISKVTAGAKNFKVSWKAVPAKQKITKYQLRYKVKGAKKWATKTVSAKKTNLTVKKLVKGKTYQIQVRSYKTVKGVKYYSAWSKAKTSGKIK
jgi:hypothetical protein